VSAQVIDSGINWFEVCAPPVIFAVGADNEEQALKLTIEHVESNPKIYGSVVLSKVACVGLVPDEFAMNYSRSMGTNGDLTVIEIAHRADLRLHNKDYTYPIDIHHPFDPLPEPVISGKIL
jgi:hypothetical protein